MATIKSVIRKDKINSKGECQVIVLYTHSSKSVKFSTGVKIDPKFWIGNKNQRYPISKTLTGYKSKSDIIYNVVQRIEDILVDIKREKIEPENKTIPYFSVNRFMSELDCSKSFIYKNLIASGKLNPVHINKRVYFKKEEVMRLYEGGGNNNE